MMELSRLHAFGPLVAQATRLLFYSLSEADSTAMRQLAKWLAMHVTNTPVMVKDDSGAEIMQLSWPWWSEWVTECEGEPDASQKTLFCRLVVDHLGRAVVGDVVRSSVPLQLHDAMAGNPTPEPPLLVSATGDHDLTPLYDAVRTLVEGRVEIDDMLNWLEAPNPAALVPTGLEEEESWRSSLLLSAIITEGEAVPSAVLLLMDRYSDALRSFSTTPAAQIALVSTLSQRISEPGYFVTLLDGALRRGIVPPSASVAFIAQGHLASLATSGYTYSILETSMDRGLDLVRAAVLQREAAGPGGVYDLSTDSQPLSTFLPPKPPRPAKVARTEADGADSADPDKEGQKEDQEEEEDEEEDPLSSATEAVIAALHSARFAYRCLLSRLVAAAAARHAALAEAGKEGSDADLEGWNLSALSLLKRTLRAYAGLERYFAARGLSVAVADNEGCEAEVAEATGCARGEGERRQASLVESTWLGSL